MVNIHGQMVDIMRAIGEMENNKVKEYIIYWMVKLEKVYGKKVIE